MNTEKGVDGLTMKDLKPFVQNVAWVHKKKCLSIYVRNILKQSLKQFKFKTLFSFVNDQIFSSNRYFL